MDFVTHAAVGALAGRAITRAEGGHPASRAAALGALAALLPDVDHVLEWRGAEEYFLYHRTATHSLVFAAAAAVLTLAWPRPGRLRRAAIVLGALASHLLLDVATPFGTALLWPFSERMFAIDALPIVAPWFAGAALIASFLAAPRGRRGAWVALATIALLLLFQFGVARRAAAKVPLGTRVALSVPDWRYPLRADVFELRPEMVRHYEVTPRGEVTEVGWVPRGAPLRPEVARLASRMRLPVMRRETGALIVEDAQFDAIIEGRRPIRIVEDKRGIRIEQQPIGLQPVLYFAVVGAVIAIAFWRSKYR